ncbi:hypothetical protein Csa_020198 [Cucumis sativus]|nr:hypothetical protein Csa_020198 [Cucumis sativus]
MGSGNMVCFDSSISRWFLRFELAMGIYCAVPSTPDKGVNKSSTESKENLHEDFSWGQEKAQIHIIKYNLQGPLYILKLETEVDVTFTMFSTLECQVASQNKLKFIPSVG